MSENHSSGQGERSKDDSKAGQKSGQRSSSDNQRSNDDESSQNRGKSGNFVNDPSRGRKPGEKTERSAS